METKGFHFENTYVVFGKSMPFLGDAQGGGLTGMGMVGKRRIRLWGLLVLLLRQTRAGFHTRIFEDKNVIRRSADHPTDADLSPSRRPHLFEPYRDVQPGSSAASGAGEC